MPVNHLNEDIFKQAHQTSARYAREQSEFKAVPGFSAHSEWVFAAPFVAESRVRFGLKLQKSPWRSMARPC